MTSTCAAVFSTGPWNSDVGPMLIISCHSQFWVQVANAGGLVSLPVVFADGPQGSLSILDGIEVSFKRSELNFFVTLTKSAQEKFQKLVRALANVEVFDDPRVRGAFQYIELDSLDAPAGREDFIIVAELVPGN